MTSGYPDANGLAVLMCDRPTFLPAVIDRLRAEGERKGDQWVVGRSTLAQYYDSFRQSVQLLRSGDFATMDELSNLALGGQQAGEIRNLKKLMRFVLALNNPDMSHWAKSDYRPFVQALFDRKSELREDVSIVSFNYDPYFEYRLLRAQRTRALVRSVSLDTQRRMNQAATSGFLDPTDVEWTHTPGFCHLKLHGTCVLPALKPIERLTWPPQPGDAVNLTTDHMFRFDTLPRFLCLSDPKFASQDPPVLLPWEIISSEGKLLEQAEFDQVVGPDWQHRFFYPLFRSLWERARSDVQAADKISFVGLSAGPFMEPELRFLFHGKRDIIEAVVANPEAARYRNRANPFHSTTFCGRLLDVMYRICPGMCCNRSSSDDGSARPETTFREGVGTITSRQASEITVRNDFADFIQNEL